MQIAFFTYAWPFLVYGRDMMESFLERGHTVHFFTMDSWFGNMRAPSPRPKLRLHPFSVRHETEKNLDLLARVKLQAAGKMDVSPDSLEFLSTKLALMLPFMADFAKERAPAIDLGIGMEKGGLLWAHAWHKKTGIPFLFYCTELLSADSTVFTWPKVAAMLPFEPKAHAAASGTLVQDKYRAEYLLHYNGIERQTLFYFPVSVKPPPPPPPPPPQYRDRKNAYASGKWKADSAKKNFSVCTGCCRMSIICIFMQISSSPPCNP